MFSSFIGVGVELGGVVLVGRFVCVGVLVDVSFVDVGGCVVSVGNAFAAEKVVVGETKRDNGIFPSENDKRRAPNKITIDKTATTIPNDNSCKLFIRFHLSFLLQVWQER